MKYIHPAIKETKRDRFWILTLLIIFIFGTSEILSQQQNLSDIETNIEERIAAGELTGVFIGLVGSDSKESLLTRGTLRVHGNIPVTPHSIFEIGSISKVFTTLLLAQLMEEQGIALNDKAEPLLPDGVKLPEYKNKAITLRHLVTHTSGLPTFPDDMFPEDVSNPYADYTFNEMVRYLRNYKLKRAPGDSFEYSNLGMALVGHILEEQTGKEYEQLINERIARPLNMQSTGIIIPPIDSSRLARGHAEGKAVSNWDLPAFEAAGALRSTGTDMIKFLKAQMRLSNGELYPKMQQTQQPLFDIEQGQSKQTDKIGMGWFIATDRDTVVWHTGGTGGYRSFIGINTETGSGAVVLSNSTANISDIYFHLLDADYTLNEVRKEISFSSAKLDRFVGEYKSPMGFSFYVTQEDGKQLFIRLTGQSKAPVVPISGNIFVNRQVAAEFSFDTTKSGNVTGLTLRQRGQEISAEKVKDSVSEPVQKEVITVDASLLEQYTGTYQLAPTFSIQITLEEGQLYAQASGQQKFPIYPESKTKFFYRVVEAELEFIESNEGTFDLLKLYQAGRVLEGERIEKK